MTFAERVTLCQKLRDGYDSELLGLIQAEIDWQRESPRIAASQFFTDPHKQARFALGYREGTELLKLEQKP